MQRILVCLVLVALAYVARARLVAVGFGVCVSALHATCGRVLTPA